MLSTSFKDSSELFTQDLRLIPHNPSLINYRVVFSEWPVMLWLMNSAIIAIGITCGRVVLGVFAAYGFACFDFPGKKLLFFLVIWTMSIPFMITMIPNYIIISRLKLLNTHAGVIIPLIANAFAIFFLRQHIMSVPSALFDAAVIDGANSWQILWKIIIHLIRGAVMAITVLLGIEAWNIFFWPLLVLTKENMHTLPIGLQYFQDQEMGTFWGQLMAAATVASVPGIVLYSVARTKLLEATITSGLKN
jgi:ABC-type glycerol-3-phosphate transport system permease component